MSPTVLFLPKVSRGFSRINRIARLICNRSFDDSNGARNGSPKRSDFDSASHEKSLKDETPLVFSSERMDTDCDSIPGFSEERSGGGSESYGLSKRGSARSDFECASHENSIKEAAPFGFSSTGMDVESDQPANLELEGCFEDNKRNGDGCAVNGGVPQGNSGNSDFNVDFHESPELSEGSFQKSDFDADLNEKMINDSTLFGLSSINLDDNDSSESEQLDGFSLRRRFWEGLMFEADKVFDVLQQDGPGFDARAVLDELQLMVSTRLVREVLIMISKSINDTNKSRCAKLAYKFFVWSGQQTNYKHTSNTYNLILKIFADCDEFKAMWRLVDEMTDNGFPTTARTFNILISTCGEAGMPRRLVERFIKSKTFNYRPFKHSFNAILHSLLTINQYRLIEWVYQQMLLDGHSPDILTYNVLMCAKYRLGKLDQFHRLLDEMGRSGFVPDLHTYNILLHVLGKGDKPFAALNLLNYMEEVGCHPTVLHYTALIDGLSRAGNLDACKYFFDEMIKKGCTPDVVSYTVMIMGYVVVGELEKAQGMFDDMFVKGQLPNVFTYNSMIRGLCSASKFDEACSMLNEMESRGCCPNFLVYSTLVGNLRNAGKISEAHQVIAQMVEKGRYVHLVMKFRGYRRC